MRRRQWTLQHPQLKSSRKEPESSLIRLRSPAWRLAVFSRRGGRPLAQVLRLGSATTGALMNGDGRLNEDRRASACQAFLSCSSIGA